jgi:Na+-driven multidrug efflux pump
MITITMSRRSFFFGHGRIKVVDVVFSLSNSTIIILHTFQSFLFSGTTAMIAAAAVSDRLHNQNKNRTTSQQQRQLQEGKPKTAQTLVGALQLSTLVGLGLGLSVFVFAKQLLMAIIGGDGVVDPTIMMAALRYVKIRALGMPAAALLGSAQTACLAQGDATMPLLATLIAASSNLLMDWILIRHPHSWIGGCAGAAWATTFAQYVAAGWCLRWLLSSPSKRRQRRRQQQRMRHPQHATTSTRSFLAGRMSIKDLVYKLPSRRTFQGFLPFVIPVTTTQAGRCSTCATIDHVVSSSLGPASMAANSILTSVYYGLVPVADSLSLAAQAFVPRITEREQRSTDDNKTIHEKIDDNQSQQLQQQQIQNEKSFAMKRLIKNFTKAAGLCGLLLATVMGTLPLYSSAFTSDVAVKGIVNGCVPLLFITCLKHGLFCASEGILLGQKDMKFLGTQYGVYTFLVPYILLQLKRAALGGSSRVSLVSVWQVFLGYDLFRTILQLGRIAWLERKRESTSSS